MAPPPPPCQPPPPPPQAATVLTSHRVDMADDADDATAAAAAVEPRAASSAAVPSRPGFGAVAAAAAAPVAAGATTQPATGAEALLLAAIRAGVEVCFANPGTTEMWLVSALDRLWPAVRPVLCLHENVATGAADGYARIARRPGLTLLHLGPGLANGLANLHNARRARSPLVNLVGDMATWHRANDPPLNSPLEALAATVSGCVVVAGAGMWTAESGGGGDRSPADGGGGGGATRTEDSSGAPLARALAASLAGAGPASPTDPPGDPEDVRPVGGSVVTVIVPHDLSWEPPPPAAVAAAASKTQLPSNAPASSSAATAVAASVETAAAAAEAAEAFVRDCAAALLRVKSSRAGGGAGAAAARSALYLGGDALLVADGALLAAGQIAAAAGATLLCEGAFARVDRGAGLPALRRLPYFPQEAAAELAQYSCLVIVDARLPVANFGYKGAPGRLVTPREDEPSAVWEFDPEALAAAGWTAATALRRLAAALGPAAAAIRPLVNCGGVFAPPRRVAVPPPGRLTPASLCAVLAALQPPGCVLVDESLTSGGSYWETSQGCPPFVHLTLTGGAIGSGPPLALGAAVALTAAEHHTGSSNSSSSSSRAGIGGGTATDDAVAIAAATRRRVINLQADGSAMYSLQALWSQAREQLPITTIICANSSYAILKVEAARQRLPGLGPATRALTDLSSPRLDWVALAGGMGVPACRVDRVEDFAEKLEEALAAPGPYLIQADL